MAEIPTMRLTASEYPEWNAYVKQHKDGTVFHTTDWLQLYNPAVDVVVIRNDRKEITAGVALVSSTRFKFVTGYHGLSFTPFMGPLITPSAKPRRSSALAEDYATVQALLKGLPPAGYYDFSMAGDTVMMPYLWNGFDTSIRYHYVISGSYEAYQEGLAKQKLRDLRNAYKSVESGELILSDFQHPDALAELIVGEQDVTGMHVPRPIVDGMARFDPKREVTKGCAVYDKDGNLLAGTLLAFSDTLACTVISATSRKVRSSQNFANLLAYDSGIKWALESGRKYSFCGSVTPGIERFFRMMGGELVPVYRAQKSVSSLSFLLHAGKRFLSERKPFQVVE